MGLESCGFEGDGFTGLGKCGIVGKMLLCGVDYDAGCAGDVGAAGCGAV